jgi:hypothetical protein
MDACLNKWTARHPVINREREFGRGRQRGALRKPYCRRCAGTGRSLADLPDNRRAVQHSAPPASATLPDRSRTDMACGRSPTTRRHHRMFSGDYGDHGGTTWRHQYQPSSAPP